MTDVAPALRVHAVMLGVDDVDRAVAFYTEKLGFALTGRFEAFAFLDAGGTALMLSGDLKRARTASGGEPVEIVLAAQGVRAAYERFRERGVVFLNEPHPVDGTNEVANFEDLDGHLFSLYGLP
jgi:catechol 2,3-dioxygenase-like lactoylglutathione lyase family enzyme